MPRGVYPRVGVVPIGFIPFAEGRSVGHVVDPATGCWNWHGKRNKKGYGQLHVGRRGDPTQIAHRAYYARAFGPIPPGLQLDHKCRNTGCVRPDHLEPVTNQVNCQRGSRVRLDAGLVRELRARYARGGITFAALAAERGLNPITVQLAVMGLNWSNVE